MVDQQVVDNARAVRYFLALRADSRQGLSVTVGIPADTRCIASNEASTGSILLSSERFHLPRDATGQALVIVVEKNDKLSLCLAKDAITGTGRAGVSLMTDKPRPWVLSDGRFYNGNRSVGGNIIDNHHLDIRPVLRQRANDGARNRVFGIEARDADCDQRRRGRSRRGHLLSHSEGNLSALLCAQQLPDDFGFRLVIDCHVWAHYMSTGASSMNGLNTSFEKNGNDTAKKPFLLYSIGTCLFSAYNDRISEAASALFQRCLLPRPASTKAVRIRNGGRPQPAPPREWTTTRDTWTFGVNEKYCGSQWHTRMEVFQRR